MTQPEPVSKGYSELIADIESGVTKIPKFQRDFVWSIKETASLLDSILKGYPIGTFILWETDYRMNDVKNIGNLRLPETPEKRRVEYVLDGQQRITSLYAAYKGAEIKKPGEKKTTNYRDIVVDLSEDIEDIVTAKPIGKHVCLRDLLDPYFFLDIDKQEQFNKQERTTLGEYHRAFNTYEFSTIVLKEADIDSAIEVFTRINTGGQTLSLFEIMSAKTYDKSRNFDMQAKWDKFIEILGDHTCYETIPSQVVLKLLSLTLSKTKECKRKTILELEKEALIDNWDEVISALKYSIDYFRSSYGILVSRLLPFDSLLVLFAYFFFNNKEPNAKQKKYLEEFFWHMSLSFRYSGSTESKLAQDIKRIDAILESRKPDYSDIKLHLDNSQSLIDRPFSTGNSFCKAILCLLAYKGPKNFRDNGKVILDNSYLKIANSKNYHHFFPKGFLKGKSYTNGSNSLMNITLVSDRLNKRDIRAAAPSAYINNFQKDNTEISDALNSHFINLDGFGIESDDYDSFLEARAKWIYAELIKRLNPDG